MTDQSLIQTKHSQRYPSLSVVKYKNKVFYDNLWQDNAELTEARGRVINADGTTVVRPFTKIFNHNENGVTIANDERVLVVDKINGFMAAATYVEEVDDVVISTTGSLDSPYVDIAKRNLPKQCINEIRAIAKRVQHINAIYASDPHHDHPKASQTTWLFEICDAEDPHIINEIPGAYLIGAREVDNEAPYWSSEANEQMLDWAADRMGVARPVWYVRDRFEQVVQQLQTSAREGAVVYGMVSHTALKIKTPYYLVQKLIARKKDVLTLDKQRVDEEFYPLLDYVKTFKGFNDLDEQQRLEIMRTFFDVSSLPVE